MEIKCTDQLALTCSNLGFSLGDKMEQDANFLHFKHGANGRHVSLFKPEFMLLVIMKSQLLKFWCGTIFNNMPQNENIWKTVAQ